MSGDEESLVVTDDTESDEADLGLILQEEIVEEAETAAVAEEIDLPEVEAAGDLLGDADANDFVLDTVTEEVNIPEVEAVGESLEETGTTGLVAGAVTDEAVAEWPPPPDEVEVAGYTGVTTLDDTAAGEAVPQNEEPESALDETEAASIVEQPITGEPESPDAGVVGLQTAELGNPKSIGPYRLWLASYKTVRQAKEGWLELASARNGTCLPI